MSKEQIKISYGVEKLFSIPIHYIKIDNFEEKKTRFNKLCYKHEGF